MGQQGTYPIGGRTPAGTDTLTAVVTGATADLPLSLLTTYLEAQFAGVYQPAGSYATAGANSNITSLSGLATALSVAQGGTGSTTAATARTALSAAQSGANNDITSLGALVSTPSVTAASIASVLSKILTQGVGPVNYSTTSTIASTDLNKPLVCYPAAPITLTIPTGTVAGQSVCVTNNTAVNGATITLQTQSSQHIFAWGQASLTALVAGVGDSITLVYDGAGNWVQASGAAQIGVGQTPQNVTGSRIFGTTYPNNTGKPMTVIFSASVVPGGNVSYNLNSTGNVQCMGNSTAGNIQSSTTVLVPIGGTYAINSVSGANSLQTVTEIK